MCISSESLLAVEWDPHKSILNKQKHGISFDTARLVFADPQCIILYDDAHSLDEDRYIALGEVGALLFVVFTERRSSVRLISARLATNRERKLYYGNR